MERETRFELVPSAWKAVMLAVKHHTRIKKTNQTYTQVTGCVSVYTLRQPSRTTLRNWGSSGLIHVFHRTLAGSYIRMASSLISFLNA